MRNSTAKQEDLVFLNVLWDVLPFRKHLCGSSVIRRKSKSRNSRFAKLTPPTLPVVLKRPRLFRHLDKAHSRPLRGLSRRRARVRPRWSRVI
ncbi:MAG: hypothetical protein JNN16_01110 [Nitrospira sp.]|nr:hypothetical protein [Nitrospira sp.]